MNTALLIGAAILLLLSVLVSKVSDRFGIPVLLLFLGLGMLAGSEGVGRIYFDDPALAQFIGAIALVLILFSGGLDTKWKSVRSVLLEGILLSTFGVLITALVVGFFISHLLDFSILESLLLGAIISSTDAAAVFAVLRSKGINLKGKLIPLLELESGSNDPMAIFLTVGMVHLITQPQSSALQLVTLFLTQMTLGAAIGLGMGRLLIPLINRIRLGYDGLYPVLTLAWAFLTFGITDRLGGNGFLAVYLCGIVSGNHDFIHKRQLLRFHDGLAWLMQITMFITLGLLVFPSHLVPVAGSGLLIAALLMLIARPISVFTCLAMSPVPWREKAFLSWVGLRGAVPIILATFPMLGGVSNAETIFNVVFFVVLTSVLFQGTSIPLVARWLKVNAPLVTMRMYPIQITPMAGLKGELKELYVPPHTPAVGKSIVEMGLPDDFLVILVARGNEFIVPSGSTILQAEDILLTLSENQSFVAIQQKYHLDDQLPTQ
ncbi:MAG: potassium/proton antiporter [Anaerolineales bacterium]|nr:potassium/proton antiporter [Anaerolineales bacterium]